MSIASLVLGIIAVLVALIPFLGIVAFLPALLGGVQPGRWQEGVWSLTARSSAVAAKLSQFKPTLLRHLQERGFALRDIRIRVQPQGERCAPSAQPQPQGPGGGLRQGPRPLGQRHGLPRRRRQGRL